MNADWCQCTAVVLLVAAGSGCHDSSDCDCPVVVCGDGLRRGPEACDHAGESETCNANCTLAACGDGILNTAAGETCDDAGESQACDPDCTASICGDGTVNVSAGETCDDAGESALCNDDCTAAACGDWIINTTAGELCDHPGGSPSCDTDCTPAQCGDGTLNTKAGETCDDTGESETCDADCTVPECGDGLVNATIGEVCDDGYADPCGSCNEDCSGPGEGSKCGDGATCPELEYCDDGGTEHGDGCGASCRYEPLGGWVTLPPGTFVMGSSTGDVDEFPNHEVELAEAFQIMKTEVTVSDYEACVSTRGCPPPPTDLFFNWDVPGYENHPVNGVTWEQARAYCAWIDARLPTEAEWEYAARGGGDDITHPWGNQATTCEYAVVNDGVFNGCGVGRSWPVCSSQAGNTEHGVCDMVGNVWEWVQDWYHGSYDCDAAPNAANCSAGGTAPSDGSAWEAGGGADRVRRGGGWGARLPETCSSTYRSYGFPTVASYFIGFRCARPVPF